jgi:ribose 1,5-bisphosphokinase
MTGVEAAAAATAIQSGMQAAAAPGVFAAVVGPSGAGKDSLLREAARRLAGDRRFHFVRRVVTRAGNGDEDHDTLTEAEFQALNAAGGFAIHWMANGLSYGIPASVHDHLAAGRVVIANASRDRAGDIKRAFARALIIHVTASVATLRERLLARGREDAAAVDLRIARSISLEQDFAADIRIENNGTLESAADQFTEALIALAARHEPRAAIPQ